MQIHLYDSAAQVGQAAATLIAAQIIAKPDSVLGLATGSTPIPTYQELIRLCKGGVLDFSRVRSFNLDEYCNLPVDHEQSYHSFAVYGDINPRTQASILRTHPNVIFLLDKAAAGLL